MILENHAFLEEIFISNQMISSKSLTILGSSIQENTSIRVLSLSNNIILSDFKLFFSNVQLSSSLKSLDLSKNQLSDTHSEVVCEFLKETTINSIIFDSNLFKTIKFAESIKFNHYIEEFSISNNPLSFEEIINVLELLPIKQNLKVLGLQGYNNILYDKKLSEVLKGSMLIILKYDLDISDTKVIKDIENTLIKHNRSLVCIESKGVDWDLITIKHPLLQIKRALKANLWLSQNDLLPSESGNEIFFDVQDIVIEKQKIGEEFENNQVDEDEVIANEYNTVHDKISSEKLEFYEKNDD